MRIEISGVNSTVARLNSLSGQTRARLRQVITALGFELAANVKANRLSGQSLHVRTGNLRGGIKSRVEEDPQRIYGIVYAGGGRAYAAVHEFGFRGMVTVPAHLRRINQAFGRPIATRVVDVRSHSKQMRIPARPYMRPEFREMAPRIRTTIEAEVHEQIKTFWRTERR